MQQHECNILSCKTISKSNTTETLKCRGCGRHWLRSLPEDDPTYDKDGKRRERN